MIQRCSSKLAISLLVFAICCSLLGCRSNGGPWYKPSTYTFNNPFNKNKAGMYGEEARFAENAPSNLPREGMRPNVSTPPGGYTEQRASQQTVSSSAVPNTGVPSTVGMNSTQTTNPQVAYNGVPNQSYPAQNAPYNAQQQPVYQQQQPYNPQQQQPVYQQQSYPQSGTQPYQTGQPVQQQPTQDTTSYSQYPPGSYQGTTVQQGYTAQPEYRPGNYSY